MKAKGWVIVGAVVAGAGVAAVFLEPTGVLRGMLAGEAFFDGRPASYWGQALRSSDPVVETRAAEALKGGGKSAVPVLVALLGGPSSAGWDRATVRWKAADLIEKLNADGAGGAAALKVALKDEDAHVRTVAAKALGVVAPKESAADFIPALAEMLPAGGAETAAAARAISMFGPAGVSALPALLEATKHGGVEERRNAVRTIGKIGPGAKSAVGELLALTNDKEGKIREHAAEALGDIGPDAKDGVPRLIEMLKDPVARVRRDAVRSLGQIGAAAKPGLEPAKALLKDEDADVREAATKTVRVLSK